MHLAYYRSRKTPLFCDICCVLATWTIDSLTRGMHAHATRNKCMTLEHRLPAAY